MAYRATERYRKTPVRIDLDGKGVGIGGAIKIVPPPPALPYTIPEATQEQYRRLYEGGWRFMVEKVVTNVELEKPGRGDNPR